MKIIGYEIVIGDNGTHSLKQAVQLLLRQGWELYGFPSFEKNYQGVEVCFQPMILRMPSPSSIPPPVIHCDYNQHLWKPHSSSPYRDGTYDAICSKCGFYPNHYKRNKSPIDETVNKG